MLSGDPGAGKTFVALAIAAAITSGRKPCTGEPCFPAHVLYLSVENFHLLRAPAGATSNGVTRPHLSAIASAN